ncbi:glycoside hydrolase family 99-like domain-containing protein [Paraburkholderia aspalathi]|uniref:glycoside hydrolase family 99-like domain-containing protein n=1 Tax=Paraburkholderia aspalathi TaxID=1324617 RepID=UPI0038B6F8FA
MNKLLPKLTVASFILGLMQQAYSADVGVYYYPGWRASEDKNTWNVIRANGGLTPILGFYDVENKRDLDQQFAWMNRFGINYVVFDWYANVQRGGEYYSPAVSNFIESKTRGNLKFSIYWDNSVADIASLSKFDRLVTYWATTYASNPEYYRPFGKAVVFIGSPKNFEGAAAKIGVSTRSLLLRANTIAKQKGAGGFFFVAISQAIGDEVRSLQVAGYDAISTYNYQYGPTGTERGVGRSLSHSYAELTAGYKENWNWMIGNSPIPYLVPLTSGWDRKPWGGSQDAAHDNSVSSPDSFEQHLRDAKKLVDEFPSKTLSTVVICCWNEYGEGSIIEPTKQFDFSYLQRVKTVFATEKTK